MPLGAISWDCQAMGGTKRTEKGGNWLGRTLVRGDEIEERCFRRRPQLFLFFADENRSRKHRKKLEKVVGLDPRTLVRQWIVTWRAPNAGL
jgi:hypothetical protein